jgi:uncharacterized membrane-anchored protein
MRSTLLLAVCLSLGVAGAQAQEISLSAALEASFTYRQGDVVLGDGLATLHVPASFRYLGPEDSRRLLIEGWGNPPMDAPLGMILPTALSPLSEDGWGVVITYDEDGYVEDDEAETLNYSELLADMQEGTRAESEARAKDGYESIELVGWASPPRYDAATHKLYWAQELAFGGTPEHTLNYGIRVLGRRGVLVLNAVSAMSMLNAVQADMQSVMSFVDFSEGHRYADFVPGVDKVAVYGIGALVAGKLAAKVGLFKLLLPALVAAKKLVIVGVVALAAFFRRLFGRKTPAEAPSA